MFKNYKINKAAKLLRTLPRGRMPQEIFYALSEKVVLPTIELVLLRQGQDGIEILLTKRPDDDPYWPDGWHLPGTVLLSTDKEHTYETAFKRVLDGELKQSVELVDQLSHFETQFWESGRGREVDQMFIAVADQVGEIPDGAFFPINKLPKGLLHHYGDVFERAVNSVKSSGRL